MLYNVISVPTMENRTYVFLKIVFHACSMEPVLFAAVPLHQPSHTAPVRHSQKFLSRWGELNPRPIPYQGIAIPLSHSGI